MASPGRRGDGGKVRHIGGIVGGTSASTLGHDTFPDQPCQDSSTCGGVGAARKVVRVGAGRGEGRAGGEGDSAPAAQTLVHVCRQGNMIGNHGRLMRRRGPAKPCGCARTTAGPATSGSGTWRRIAQPGIARAVVILVGIGLRECGASIARRTVDVPKASTVQPEGGG